MGGGPMGGGVYLFAHLLVVPTCLVKEDNLLGSHACARPSSLNTSTCANTTPCTQVQLWVTPGGRSVSSWPLPPPPPPNGEARCGAL